MNRVSVILLCLTSLAIFFILRKHPEIDLQKYKDQITSLQNEINQLEGVNDSLVVQAAVLDAQVKEYDKTIQKLNDKLNVIEEQTKKKLNAVDNFDSNQLQKFFSDRYRTNSNPTNK